MFAKTKMCKFFILGSCAKGADCRFAHFKEELNELPDLLCTKLCKALINTGQCLDSNCQNAHSKDELRSAPAGAEQSDADSLKGDPALSQQGQSKKRMSASSGGMAAEHPAGNAALGGLPQMGSLYWVLMPNLQQDCCASQGWPAGGAAWPPAMQWSGDGHDDSRAWLQEEELECWSAAAKLLDQGASPPPELHKMKDTPREETEKVTSGSPMLMVKNTFLHVDSGKPVQGLKQVSTWGGDLSALECSEDDETVEGAPSLGRQASSGASDGE